MKQAIFGIVVVAVVCAVFVLSQPSESNKAESKPDHTSTELVGESGAKPQIESPMPSAQDLISSAQESTESESSPKSSEDSSVRATPASEPRESVDSHNARETEAQAAPVTIDSQSSAKTRRFFVCADNVAVYERSGRYIIGNALKGLAGEEAGRIDDKMILRVVSYHKGERVLYGDSVFSVPMLRLHGVDFEAILEVAIAKSDLSQDTCQMRDIEQSAPQDSKDPQPKKAQSYGNI